MTVAIARLLAANVLMFACGAGVIVLLGVARSWHGLLARIGVAYLAGIAFVGVTAATLAVVRIPFGWLELALSTVLSLVAALRLLLRGGTTPLPSRSPNLYLTSAGIGAIAATLAFASRAFAVTPLAHWDAWAMWGMKGRALASFDGADPSVFANPALHTLHLQYPLFVPPLEAIGYRSMGGFDGRAIHVQFVLLAAAFVAALAGLLWDRVPAIVLWPALGALVTAPQFLGQLLTAYADVPLGIFVACGVVAAARWLVTDERWSLDVATLFFAAAVLTKNEGTAFALVAFVSLAVCVGRRRDRLWLIAQAAAIDLAVLVPWWVYLRKHHVHEDSLMIGRALTPHALGRTLDRGWGVFHGLLRHMLTTGDWALLVPLFAVAVAACALTRRWRVGAFGTVFFGLALLGLASLIVVSKDSLLGVLGFSYSRYVATIVLTAGALTPLLVGEAVAGVRERSVNRAG